LAPAWESQQREQKARQSGDDRLPTQLVDGVRQHRDEKQPADGHEHEAVQDAQDEAATARQPVERRPHDQTDDGEHEQQQRHE
jgi:hypothetical protein